jgi:hypothetical protein
METIELSTGAIFPKTSVSRILRFREKVDPVELNADGGDQQAPTERDVLVIEMKEGPSERVIGEHAAIDAAKLKQQGFTINET